MKNRKGLMTILVILIILIQDVLLSMGIVNYIEKEEREKKSTIAYFTDKGLKYSEMRFMREYFMVEEDPYSLDFEEEHWPDYSYYTIAPTEKTEKVVSLVNYHLFINPNESDISALEIAKEYGFSKDNWITVDWVMENPKDAIKICDELGYDTWNHDLIWAGYEVGDYHMIQKSTSEETEE